MIAGVEPQTLEEMDARYRAARSRMEGAAVARVRRQEQQEADQQARIQEAFELVRSQYHAPVFADRPSAACIIARVAEENGFTLADVVNHDRSARLHATRRLALAAVVK